MSSIHTTRLTDWFFSNLLVLYGEPITIEELQNTIPNFNAALMVHHGATVGLEPLTSFEDMGNDEAYWEFMIQQGTTYEIYVAPASHPSEGVIGHPLPHNRRVLAPQPPTVIVIDDDDEGSYTGSSDSLNNTLSDVAVPPPVTDGPVHELYPNNVETDSAGTEKIVTKLVLI